MLERFFFWLGIKHSNCPNNHSDESKYSPRWSHLMTGGQIRWLRRSDVDRRPPIELSLVVQRLSGSGQRMLRGQPRRPSQRLWRQVSVRMSTNHSFYNMHKSIPSYSTNRLHYTNLIKIIYYIPITLM